MSSASTNACAVAGGQGQGPVEDPLQQKLRLKFCENQSVADGPVDAEPRTAARRLEGMTVVGVADAVSRQRTSRRTPAAAASATLNLGMRALAVDLVRRLGSRRRRR